MLVFLSLTHTNTLARIAVIMFFVKELCLLGSMCVQVFCEGALSLKGLCSLRAKTDSLPFLPPALWGCMCVCASHLSCEDSCLRFAIDEHRGPIVVKYDLLAPACPLSAAYSDIQKKTHTIPVTVCVFSFNPSLD